LTTHNFALHDERVTPDEWRERVGQHITTRREELRLSVRAAAKRAEVSDALWHQIESGRRGVAADQFVTVNPRPATRAQVSVSLGWTPDSIDRLASGKSLVVATDPLPTDAQALLAEHTRAIEALHSQMERLRRDHEDLAVRFRALADGRPRTSPSARTLATAAEGASGAPPKRSRKPLRGPSSRPEDGEHITD
jgi:hypothetical protein